MTAITTPKTPPGLSLDVAGLPPVDIVPEALILTCATQAGFVDGDAPVVRVPYIDFDGDIGFVPEGAPIPESDPDYSEVAIATGKIAVLGRVSREQMEGHNAGRLIAASMVRDLTRKANAAFLAQAAPTAPAITPPAGLLNQSPADGGGLGASLDELIDAVAGVEDANGTATDVIASPSAWASLSKLKSGTGSNAALLGAGTQAGERSVLGLPVHVSASVPSGSLLVVDKSAILAAVGKVMPAKSEHVFFGSDAIGVRVTWRFGAVVVDSARVVKVTVT